MSDEISEAVAREIFPDSEEDFGPKAWVLLPEGVDEFDELYQACARATRSSCAR